MAESGQTYKTHVRFFPPFHFFALSAFLAVCLRQRDAQQLGGLSAFTPNDETGRESNDRVVSIAFPTRLFVCLVSGRRLAPLRPASTSTGTPTVFQGSN